MEKLRESAFSWFGNGVCWRGLSSAVGSGYKPPANILSGMSDQQDKKTPSGGDSVDAGMGRFRMRSNQAPGVEALLHGAASEQRERETETTELSFETEVVEVGEKKFSWWIGGGMVLLALLCGGVLLFLRHDESREPDGTASMKSIAGGEPSGPEPMWAWKGALPFEVAERFTEAETTDERLKWVRDPDRVRPALEAFFTDGPGATERVANLNPMKPTRTKTLALVRFHVKTEAGGDRLLCVALTEEGAKVDFDCYARHGSVPWKKLLSGEVEIAEEVRVFVKRGGYYNYHFDDETRWRHFVATTPDLDRPLDIYVERGSETERRLMKRTARGQVRMMLGIRSVEKSYQKRQFKVMETHGVGWVADN